MLTKRSKELLCFAVFIVPPFLVVPETSCVSAGISYLMFPAGESEAALILLQTVRGR